MNRRNFDRQARKWLRKWPKRTCLWSKDGEPCWVRARPAPEGFPRGLPTFRIAGAGGNTQPDGLYIRFGVPQDKDPHTAGFVDVIAIEACGSIQNFHDKRSRYCSATYAGVVYVPRAWMGRNITVQGGGQMPIWQAAGVFNEAPDRDLYLPVRHLRVLYAILHRHWKTVRRYVLHAHEFLFRHQQLGQYNAQPVQAFLERMTPTNNIFD